jgi:isopenicillin N synthase-like dioxygenase
MDQHVAASTQSGAPPIISLAGMRSADPADRAAVAAAFRSACLDKGFLYIVDHGISSDLIDAVFAQTKRFFDLPAARKLDVDMGKSSCNRGYEPLRGQTLQPGAPPDLKEGYYIGTDLPADDPRVLAGLFNHGPNQWPADLPGWRETMETYFAQMTGLCRITMRALALSLELPEDHFEKFCDDPVVTLRLLHYPPQPGNPLPDEKGCGEHTDFGAVTFLLQDNSGGLQVWDERLGWIDAPPVPGSFVVNLGDLIARWTNDRYRSTLHRVVNRSGHERYSVPFFFTGRAEHDVNCLPNCLAAGEQPKYRPTTAIGHLQEMYDRTYARAKAE